MSTRIRRQAEDGQIGVIDNNPYPDIDFLYPDIDYSPPLLPDALGHAEIPNGDRIADLCYDKARNAKDKKGNSVYNSYSLNEEDAATIFCYTYENSDPACRSLSPYLVINTALETRNPELLEKAKHLIWKLLTALRKLPRVRNKPLYRGISKKVDFRDGDIICWHRFSSTTLNMGMTQHFLHGKGSLFMLQNRVQDSDDPDEEEEKVWAYDLRDFSFFRNEEELLLEPEQVFSVKSSFPFGEMINVQLEFVKHPFLLPNRIKSGARDAHRETQIIQNIDKNLPTPVVEVVRESVRFNYVVVKWNNILSKFPKDKISITAYEILVRKADELEVGKVVFSGQNNSTPIAELFPNTRYLIKCRIKCGDEISQDSSVEVTTPSVPPLKLEVEQNSLTCFGVKLRWNDVIDRKIHINQGQMYKLLMRQGKGNWTQVYLESNPCFEKNDLIPNTHYSFKVQLVLVNSKEDQHFCPFSETLELQTLPVPVPNITLADDSLSYCSMTINWNTTPQQLTSICGFPYHYEVFMDTNDSNRKLLHKGNEKKLSIDDLRPGNNHHFFVKMILDISPSYESLFNDSLQVATPNIPIPVIQVIDDTLSIRSVELSWHADFSQFPLKKSMFKYQLFKSNNSTWELLSDGHDTQMKVDKLDLDTVYHFRARAVLSNGIEGHFCDDEIITTSVIPTLIVDWDEMGNVPCIGCNAKNEFLTIGKEDRKKIQYEYEVTDDSSSIRSKTRSYTTSSKSFSTNLLVPEHSYSVKGRVIINDDKGPWCQTKSFRMPPSFALFLYNKITLYFSWIVWELGLLGITWFTIYQLGLYCDGKPDSLLDALITLTVVFGTTIAYPIVAITSNCQLPPLIGCLVMPLKNPGKKGNNAVKVFYAISLFLVYVGAFITLILACAKVSGSYEGTAFSVVQPIIIAWTVVPAITLIVLFACRSKGRYSLLLLYVFVDFTLFLVIGMALHALTYQQYLFQSLFFWVYYSIIAVAFIYHTIAFICSCVDGEPGFFWFHLLPFDLLMVVPTFYVMPFLTLVHTFTVAKFSPVYIDIIVAAIASIALKIIDLHEGEAATGSKMLSRYIRNHFNAVSMNLKHVGLKEQGTMVWIGIWWVVKVLLLIIFGILILPFWCIKKVIQHL